MKTIFSVLAGVSFLGMLWTAGADIPFGQAVVHGIVFVVGLFVFTWLAGGFKDSAED